MDKYLRTSCRNRVAHDVENKVAETRSLYIVGRPQLIAGNVIGYMYACMKIKRYPNLFIPVIIKLYT